METLERQYRQVLKHVSTRHIRSIYGQINWASRLIGIKGARGVGKTTLMLQRIVKAFVDIEKALYVTLDNLWFANHTLVELAEKAVRRGITHLFLDEVHRLPGWERQVKNIYDMYPSLNVVFTGSSLLVLDHSIADLSRRCLMYSMPGLSFREYLGFEGYDYPVFSLQDILYNHESIAVSQFAGVDILKLFSRYLAHGYYPFYKGETIDNYLVRVQNMITAVIDYDVPAVASVEYSTLIKLKQVLTIMAAQTPSPINLTSLSANLEITKNQMIKLLSLLGSADILRLLYYKAERNPKSMAKPQKVLISNPSIAHALGQPNLGKVRESFLACMLAVGHEVAYPKDGDLMVDGRYLFEVGGKSKGFEQISNIPDSFVAADDIQFGLGNKIPLWLFGFLY